MDAAELPLTPVEPTADDLTKELRVKIGVHYHLKLHALKLLKGKPMQATIEEALDAYFDKVSSEPPEGHRL